MTRIPRSVTPAILLLLLIGCGAGSVSYTIDDDALNDMSRYGQVAIYDAENEIVVALDKVDQQRDELERTRRQMAQANRRLAAAEKRGNSLGVDVVEGWLVYLGSIRRWIEAKIEYEQIGIVLAKANVELTKAEVIQREDLLGGDDFDIVDFRDQVEQFRKRRQEQLRRVRALRKEAEKKELNWWQLRRKFVAQTGDFNSGLWID